RREADSIWAADLFCDFVDLQGLAVHTINRFLQFALGLESLVVAIDAVRRIGEPDTAIGMHNDVVRRIQRLAFELLRDDGNRAIRLIARDAPAAVLARKLTPFVVERIAVAVPGRIAKRRDTTVVFDPSQLNVIGNVTPDKKSSGAVPCRPFGPHRAGM